MTQNPQHNIEQPSATDVVNGWFSAFSRGDIDQAISLLDREVIWHVDGDPSVTTTGLLCGPEQVREWLTRFPQHFAPRKFAIDRLIEHGGSVLALGYFRHTVLSTGNTVGSDMIIHFSIANGKITRYQIFEDSALLRRAFDADDDWQQQQIRINGTLYRYRDCGEGPVLLFAHGLLLNADAFAAQVRVLSQNYRCIVLDMPGHGQSGFRPDGWTLDDISRDLALLIGELSLGKVTVIGQSQGGMVAIRLAARYPEHIAGLVLIGTSARAEYPERLAQWQAHRATILTGSASEREALFGEIQQRLNGDNWLQQHPQRAEEERRIMLAHHRTGLALALDAAVFTRGDIRALLPQVNVPTLVLCGECDGATPPELSREIARGIMNARLQLLPDTGHHPVIEAPEAVTAAIDAFLRERRAGI